MTSSIGTKKETSLHRDLKFRYAGSGGETELEVAGYIADCRNAAGDYIEVQTGNFGSLRQKAQKLSELGTLRIVYPVVVTKYLEVTDSSGKRLYRRKSPLRGSLWNLFDELIYAPDLPLLPRLVIELALVDAAELRVRDGKGSWRRKGTSIRDRRLITLHETICLGKPADYLRFIPFAKNEHFTSAALGEKAGITAGSARKALYVLTKMGLLEKTGKQGRSALYRIVYRRKKANLAVKTEKRQKTI